jgi:hypothetical protein
MTLADDRVTAPRKAPNLLLQGYADDDTLDRVELAEQWATTDRTIRAHQHPTDGS